MKLPDHGLALPSLALAALLGLGAGPARAQASFWIDADGGAEIALRLDRLGKAGETRAHTNAFAEIEADLVVTSSTGLGLVGAFRLEQRDRATIGRSQVLRDETAYVDQLYLTYTARPLALAAGKIHPRFGFAWDAGPGLFGSEFGERYEIAEQIGGGIDISLPDLFGLPPEWGTSSIRAEIFQADRSFLSAGLFNHRYQVEDPETGRLSYRARLRRSAGGPGNTPGLSSTVLSLAGQGMTLPLGSLDYTFGMSHRRAGNDAREAGLDATERGVVAGLAWAFRPVPDLRVVPVVEAVRLKNVDGFQGRSRDFLMAGLALEWGPFALSYTEGRQWDEEDGGKVRSAQRTAGLDIALEELLPPQGIFPGLTMQIGWRQLEEGSVTANDFGAALVFGYRF
ncbi:hypothetical protein [Roseomonas xinghualingensis]|uniref:hypothetical protein n=1 Tax=Roseomonas xinghualingensis TaxID=2986475 RepID=UPI0021F17581|nr:hypothetical protein [Roseomonas sp. SXEYE001]MCV4206261.1 hypothetical protein [Roseomonas sp. SXEYE001]